MSAMVIPDLMSSRRTSCRFTGGVALFFVVPDWADDISDRTIRFRKSSSRRAGLRHEVLGRACVWYREYGGNDSGKRRTISHHCRLPQQPVGGEGANLNARSSSMSGAGKPLDFPDLIDLGAARGFNLNRLSLGLANQRARDR